MQNFIILIAAMWLATWKTVANLAASLELLVYLAFGQTDRQEVGGLVLTQLDSGAGWAEVYLFLWFDRKWARSLLEQHARRQNLKGAWH